MKKYLIRTVLVLAAITACNKEVDTPAPVVDNGQEEAITGKVTLTFNATIGEETRTAYTNDKTASWVDGDAISVCLTDGESFEIVDFTTEDGVTFSAEVSQGYTTIASAVYPANDEYAVFPEDFFDVTGNGDVIGLYLTNVLDIGLADDKGTLIPMVGSYDASTQTMSFHHVCGALKVTLSNIPDDATLFTFHANNQQLVFDFPLTNDGRIELGTPVQGNDDMDLFFHFTVDEETTTRSFYIPIPDGSLAAGAYVTLENEDGELLYKKVLSTAQTFDKNQIKRLPTAECWTKNDSWNAYYYGPYVQSNRVYTGIHTQNVDSIFNLIRLTDNDYTNKYNSSIAEYLASSDFTQALSGFTKTYDKDITMGYTSYGEDPYYIVIVGLDNELHFTGEYNCIKVIKPSLETPTGWSISVSENSTNYTIRYIVPTNNTQWQYIPIKVSDLQEKYLGNLECAIYTLIRSRKASHESDPTTWLPRTGIQAYNVTYSGDYIILCAGIDESYMPTGAFCRLDYNFTKETPTDDYNRWIGTWTVTDNQATPKINTWTVSRKRANHTYNIKGIGSASAIICEALFDSDTGNLVVQSQENFWIINTAGADRLISLYGRKNDNTFDQGVYNIMYAEFANDAHTSATLNAYNEYPSYYLPYFINGILNENTSYGIRYLPSTMTKN